jgi:hypothetical protein
VSAISRVIDIRLQRGFAALFRADAYRVAVGRYESIIGSIIASGTTISKRNLQLRYIQKRLDGCKIVLELSEAAKQELAVRGYDPQLGARLLRRAIEREILNPLAQRLLAREFMDGDTIRVDYRDRQFVFERADRVA